MADLMAKVGFGDFIASAARFGLPVGFLRDVQRSSYTYSIGDESVVSPWLNTMTLEQSVLDGVKDMSPSLPYGESVAIQTIYHESTHAWMDLNDDRDSVALITKEGLAYYKGAPLTMGAAADDPNRVFQEAIASYVGHRASSWWACLEVLAVVEDKLRNAPPNKTAAQLKMLRGGRDDYQRRMGARVFGYQMRGSLWNRQQAETKLPISGKIKDFADRVLLEDKISDHFSRSGQLAAAWNRLAVKYPELGPA